MENRTPPSDEGNCYNVSCPARELLDHVFSRWGSLVLGAHFEGRMRYGELRARIGGISEKMLAQTLRCLERDGLIRREARPVVPPHVEYELTLLGRACAERVDDLVGWIQANIGEVTAAHARYERSRLPRGEAPVRDVPQIRADRRRGEAGEVVVRRVDRR